jgi:hypothetical protein
MERDERQIPIEELIMGAAISLFHSRIYPRWPELVRRFAAGSVVSIASASIFLIDQVAKESKRVFKST